MDINKPNITEEEANRYADAISEKYRNHPVLSQVSELKESDLMRVINGAYIAERFFKRSRGWFSKKLNHCLNNGKPDEFTPAEIETLANALDTIAYELQDLADTLRDK